MTNRTDRLGFHAWFESFFGTMTAERRETYEWFRWAWKELEWRGLEPTLMLVCIVLLFTPADTRARGKQILDEGYAFLEADLRRHQFH